MQSTPQRGSGIPRDDADAPVLYMNIAQAVISHLLSLKFSTFRLKDVYDTILFYLLVLQN